MQTEVVERRLASRARRMAQKHGFRVVKSRRSWSIDNFGGFMLVHNDSNCVVAGERFNMSSEDVIQFCLN